MINVKNLKNGIYYAQSRDRYSFYIIKVSPDSITTPFYIDNGGTIEYAYDCIDNTYNEERATLVTIHEFMIFIESFKTKFEVEYIFIKK